MERENENCANAMKEGFFKLIVLFFDVYPSKGFIANKMEHRLGILSPKIKWL